METTSVDRNRKSEIRVGGPDSRLYDLAERLRDEAVARKACIILPPFIGAWTNKPA
jgi:hypothetical protein